MEFMKKLFLNILSKLSLIMASSGISGCSRAGICQKDETEKLYKYRKF